MTREFEGKKTFEIEDFKSDQNDEGFYISGYANTKGRADAYGDIPTNFKGRKVYELKRFKLNPVMLADHNNSIGSIMGFFTESDEDEKGLRFKAKLLPLDQAHNPIVKHGIQAYMSGFARGLSIGGLWQFEDNDNPKHLTKAIIHEISGVAVGADSHALTNSPKPKNLELYQITKAEKLDIIRYFIKLFSLAKTQQEQNVISNIIARYRDESN